MLAPLMHLSELDVHLSQLRDQELLREADDELVREQLATAWGDRFLDACSNDYLDLARRTVSRETLGTWINGSDEGASVGAGASRLVYGTHPSHRELERDVAEWLGYEEALLFSSGYAANVGALGALLSKEDAVFSDALNHASLIDGIRLSGARAEVFAHLQLDELERRLSQAAARPARWVIVESYYSMDGDGPDWAVVQALCERYDAHLYVDEAHAIGTFGPAGRGLCARWGVRPDVLLAGFGKAVGAQGACVCSSKRVRAWLWNRARSFVFSTAPSPWLAQLIRGHLEHVRGAEAERARLEGLAAAFRARLRRAGLPLVPGSWGPIVGVVLGSAQAALGAAARLRDQGILTQAIRPPTVPDGQSRLRVVLRAAMSDADVERLAEEISRAARG